MRVRALGWCAGLLAVGFLGVAIDAAEKTVKPKTTPATNQTTTAAKSSDLDLSGTWSGYVVDGRGQNPNRGSTHLELTIQGNQIVGQKLGTGGGPLGTGAYTIRPDKNFYFMDATETKSRGKPKQYLGIVRFEPDVMRWCVATSGNPRPTDLETKGNNFLLVLRRQKTQGK